MTTKMKARWPWPRILVAVLASPVLLGLGVFLLVIITPSVYVIEGKWIWPWRMFD